MLNNFKNSFCVFAIISILMVEKIDTLCATVAIGKKKNKRSDK